MRFSALSLALNLPPLSKGGGLTARHKLLLCCVLLATRPPFLFTKLFCRQDGGIALHPPTFSSPQPSQKDNNPSLSTMSLPPLLKVRCCRPKKFGQLPEGLLPIRTINEIFRTIPSTKLASLVKGRWLDGKAQALILLLSVCDTPTFFIYQTFLLSRRRDCFTPTNLFIPTTIAK